MKTKKNNLVKKYNKSEIMRNAWKMFKSNQFETFGECLRQSWHIAKNGIDTITFEQIYNKYYKQILFYVNGWVKNMTDAEDITAKVFIKFHKNFNNYDVYKAKVNTYLHVIAKTTIKDFYRTNHSDRYLNVDSFVDDEGKELFQFVDDSNNSNDVENIELSTSIKDALNELKPKYKEIAELYFIKELKYEEISNMLDIPMGTVKGMINRCRTKLQKSLENVRQLAN